MKPNTSENSNSQSFIVVRSHRRNSSYKTSEFPKAYLPESLNRDIQIIRTYYSVLQQSQIKNRQSKRLTPNKSNEKIKTNYKKNEIEFVFKGFSKKKSFEKILELNNSREKFRKTPDVRKKSIIDRESPEKKPIGMRRGKSLETSQLDSLTKNLWINAKKINF